MFKELSQFPNSLSKLARNGVAGTCRRRRMVGFVQNEQGPGPELPKHTAQTGGVDLVVQQTV